jgi:hypothetical protein
MEQPGLLLGSQAENLAHLDSLLISLNQNDYGEANETWSVVRSAIRELQSAGRYARRSAVMRIQRAADKKSRGMGLFHWRSLDLRDTLRASASALDSSLEGIQCEGRRVRSASLLISNMQQGYAVDERPLAGMRVHKEKMPHPKRRNARVAWRVVYVCSGGKQASSA